MLNSRVLQIPKEQYSMEWFQCGLRINCICNGIVQQKIWFKTLLNFCSSLTDTSHDKTVSSSWKPLTKLNFPQLIRGLLQACIPITFGTKKWWQANLTMYKSLGYLGKWLFSQDTFPIIPRTFESSLQGKIMINLFAKKTVIMTGQDSGIRSNLSLKNKDVTQMWRIWGNGWRRSAMKLEERSECSLHSYQFKQPAVQYSRFPRYISVLSFDNCNHKSTHVACLVRNPWDFDKELCTFTYTHFIFLSRSTILDIEIATWLCPEGCISCCLSGVTGVIMAQIICCIKANITSRNQNSIS